MPIKGPYLILIVLLLILCFRIFYRQVENFFIFYPDARFEAVPSSFGLMHQEISFLAEDGTKLHGWFFPLKEDAPLMLFCHGNAGNISHRLENVKLLLDHGLQVFIFDYRGYGRSKGRPSEQGLYQDGLAAYDFLTAHRRIVPKKIVVFGRSLGAAVAIEIALHREVKCLIIESAFTSTKEMAKSLPLFMPLSFMLPPHYNNMAKISRINAPKLIIHGEADEIVPFSMGRKLYHAATPPKYFYPISRAGHNDTYMVAGRKYFRTLSTFARQSAI